VHYITACIPHTIGGASLTYIDEFADILCRKSLAALIFVSINFSRHLTCTPRCMNVIHSVYFVIGTTRLRSRSPSTMLSIPLNIQVGSEVLYAPSGNHHTLSAF